MPHSDDAVKIVEAARRDLLTELDSLYTHIDLPDLASVAEGIEEIAKAHVVNAVTDHAQQVFRCHSAESEHCIIDEDNNEYHVRLSEDVQDDRALVLSLIPVGTAPPFKRQQIRPVRIVGHGRYNRVRFMVPSSRWCDGDLLQQFVRGGFETAYGWFEQRVIAFVTDNRDLLASALYRYLRSILPHEETRQNVWFASVTTDWGFRILDPEVTRAAFSLVQPNAHRYGYSTHRLVAEILATALPRQKLLMQAAVTQKQCVDADLSQAIYRREGSVYASALAALYGCESFSVFPILTEGKVCVVSLFPTNQRAQLEPLFREHESQLRRECEKSLSPIQRTLQRLTMAKKSVQVGPVGEFIGGVIKSIFSS